MENERQEEIKESIWKFINETKEKYSLSLEEVLDCVLETLEAANIPEEESVQVRMRAAEEGKTFSQKVTEYVAIGLEEDDAFDRAQRLSSIQGCPPIPSTPSSRMN